MRIERKGENSSIQLVLKPQLKEREPYFKDVATRYALHH